MDLFFSFLSGVLGLVGGILLLRHGLNALLERRVRAAMTSVRITPWRGFAIGTAAAAILQSSTAVSLISIGLVSANILSFAQSLGIILGANIGTCTTVQLIALKPSGAFLLLLFLFALLCALFFPKWRRLLLPLLGIGMMFGSLSVLSAALQQTSDLGALTDWALRGNHPVLYPILLGMVITVILQSSSAATALLMTLSASAMIDLQTAAYVIYGNNIGSCLSSLLVGAAAPLEARRTALSHFILNFFGALLFLPLTPFFSAVVASLSSDFEGQIALLHTLFNVISSLAVMPFIHLYAKFVIRLVPGRK